jgi:hypothetical protein
MSTSSVDRLAVKCPACGKAGKLPVGVTVYPSMIKCKGCQMRFNPSAEALNAVGVKEPEIYDLEQPAAGPVKRQMSCPDRAPVKQDPTFTPLQTRPAKKSRRALWISLAVALFGFIALIVILPTMPAPPAPVLGDFVIVHGSTNGGANVIWEKENDGQLNDHDYFNDLIARADREGMGHLSNGTRAKVVGKTGEGKDTLLCLEIESGAYEHRLGWTVIENVRVDSSKAGTPICRMRCRICPMGSEWHPPYPQGYDNPQVVEEHARQKHGVTKEDLGYQQRVEVLPGVFDLKLPDGRIWARAWKVGPSSPQPDSPEDKKRFALELNEALHESDRP